MGASQNYKILVVGKGPKYEKNNVDLKYLSYCYPSAIKTLAKSIYYLVLCLFLNPCILQKNISCAFSFNSTIRGKLKKFNLLSLIHLKKPKAIHIQWAEHISLFESLIKEGKIPLILSLRGRHVNISPLLNSKTKNLYQRVFPKIDAFHAVSKDLKSKAVDLGANEKRIKVIYTGINISEIKSIVNNTPPPHQNEIQFLCVGRHHWIKGYRLLFEPLSKIKNENIKFRCTIVGHGDTEELKFLAYKYNLWDNFHFVNQIDQKSIFKLMSQSSALILPSYSEGIANVAVEALALKLPVISSNCGGMTELIKDGESGLIFDSGSINSLYLAIKKFLKMDQNEIDLLSENGKNKVWKNHDSRKQNKQIIELYQMLID